MPDYLMPYTSRKFILSIVGAILAFVGYKMGLSDGQVMTVLSPLLAFMAAEGTADIVDRAKGNNSTSTITKTITDNPTTIQTTNTNTSNSLDA